PSGQIHLVLRERGEKVKRNLTITLVEPPATVDGRLDGKLAKDIYSLLLFPPRGLPALEAVLRQQGYTDVASIDPEYNPGTNGRLTPAQWQRLAHSDVVGISAITRTANQSYELADRVRALNPRAHIVFGGPHTTALPDEALAHGDTVVLHEGDATFPDLLARLQDNPARPPLTDVPGLCYRAADGALCRTGERPFLTSEELSRLPFPTFTPEVLRGMTCNVVNTSRGCPFECEFCDVIVNFGKQFRFLDDDTTVALIRHAVSYSRKRIFFGDDIFTSNRARIKRVLTRLLTLGVKLPRWFAQVRVESAQDRELLQLMKRAHCSTVFIGLESINPETLKLYHKHATVEHNRQAIQNYHAAGIKVHGMFVLGSDADTVETIRETYRFAQQMRLDTAQFFSLTTVPGPPLTQRLAQEGRVICWGQWHLFDAQHTVIMPKRMSSFELQMGVFQASTEFYSLREAFRRLFSGDHRWFNFLLRIQGRALAHQIIRDNQGYLESLEKLHHWHTYLEREAEDLSQRVRRLVSELTISLEAKRTQVKTYLQEAMKKVSESARHLPAEYKPYASALVDRTLASLHKHLDSFLASASPAASETRSETLQS
ncbi:MAG: radical SAM protein, partial [Terriglobia bacterium]